MYHRAHTIQLQYLKPGRTYLSEYLSIKSNPICTYTPSIFFGLDTPYDVILTCTNVIAEQNHKSLSPAVFFIGDTSVTVQSSQGYPSRYY